MSRHYRRTVPKVASLLCAVLALTATAAFAAPSNGTRANIYVDGSYHSVTNGISNYDGFDQFRDASGQPLPGWEQELRSPG
jgi:hypothetical protein